MYKFNKNIAMVAAFLAVVGCSTQTFNSTNSVEPSGNDARKVLSVPNAIPSMGESKTIITPEHKVTVKASLSADEAANYIAHAFPDSEVSTTKVSLATKAELVKMDLGIQLTEYTEDSTFAVAEVSGNLYPPQYAWPENEDGTPRKVTYNRGLIAVLPDLKIVTEAVLCNQVK